MASETDIANRALSKLGEARILSLSDDSKPARAMLAAYSHLRDAELASHPWRFAVKRATLPASTETPAWGFSKVYEKPTNDLRTLKIGEAFIDFRSLGVMYETTGYTNDSQPYEVIDGKIHTDLSAPLKYEYIARITETGLFDPMFVECLACRLAWDACEELTQSNTKAEHMARQYQRAVSEARRVNSIMSPPRRRAAGPWVQARVW